MNVILQYKITFLLCCLSLCFLHSLWKGTEGKSGAEAMREQVAEALQDLPYIHETRVGGWMDLTTPSAHTPCPVWIRNLVLAPCPCFMLGLILTQYRFVG